MQHQLSDLQKAILAAALGAETEPAISRHEHKGKVRVRAGQEIFHIDLPETPVLDMVRLGLLRQVPGGFYSLTEEGRRVAAEVSRGRR